MVREGYKQTEVGVIPEDWNVSELGNLGKFKNGINKGSEDFGHGSPFVNLMDVFGISSILEADHLGLVNSNDAEKKVYDLKEGDVLFIRSSVKPSGVGLTTVVTRDLPNTVYSGFLIRFRDSENLETDFKKYCFSEEKFRQRVIANSTVSANTNINQDNLKKLSLAYPESAAEQRSIAQALSDVDALIAALEKAIAKKRHIKTATMQQLLTGKKRLPEFSGDWQTFQISDLFEVTAGGDLVKSEYSSIKDDVYPYPIYANSVFDSGIYGYSKFKEYEGDCITVTARGTLGIAYYRPTPFVAIGRLIVLKPKDKLDSFFLSESINHRIEFASESTGVPQLTAPQISKYKLSIPVVEEQRAIATVLSDMDEAIAALETRRAKTQALKQGMMQALLTGRVRLV